MSRLLPPLRRDASGRDVEALSSASRRTPRPAAAVILTAGERVLLVRRSPALRAFPGLWAFPGGKVGSDDSEVAVEGAPGREAAGSMAAAAREVFEETGVLLARCRTPLPAKARESLRRGLLDGEFGFDHVLARAGARLHAADLVPVGERVTPRWAPFRFATTFFRAPLPPGERPSIWPGEVVESDLVSPAAALGRWLEGTMPLAPPVIGLLERWSSDDDLYRKRNLESGRPEPGVAPWVRPWPGVALIACRTRTLPPATHTNALLIGSDKQYLVDPAPEDPDERRALFARVDRLLAEGGASLAAVLVTHHHADHTGSVAEASERYRVPVGAHPETLARMPPVSGPVLRLTGGESLPLGTAPDGSGEWALRVRFTPGHAPGHLAFEETRYGAIAAGDLVSSLASILIPPEDGDLGLYMESLRRIADACRGPVLPAHGPAVVAGKRLLERQIRHREAREARLLAELGPEPRSLAGLGEAVYPADEVPGEGPVRRLALKSLASGLRKLEREGRAVRRSGGWARA